MKIAIDLQASQASNAQRGIGGYSLALTEALLVEAGGDHQIVVVMNGDFGPAFDRVADQLRAISPSVEIATWYPPRHLGLPGTTDRWSRRAAETIRDAFIASLGPDVVLITSLFEGFADAAVTSVKATSSIPTAVVLYDLIPLVRRADYLTDPAMEAWYESKIGHLRRADRLLAISGATRREAIDALDLRDDVVVDIGAAVRPIFHEAQVPGHTARRVRERFGLVRNFLMYTGGIDPRKNVDGLIEAYSRLPAVLRASTQLAIVCSVEEEARAALRRQIHQLGLADNDVILTGYVSDEDLLVLYRLCVASVFPSLHEGFGLPALEAMTCGRAVIASDRSSLPEVIGNDDALFDPTSIDSMSTKIAEVLGDDDFRAELERRGLEQSSKFSWATTARRAMQALDAIAAADGSTRLLPALSAGGTQRPRLAFLSPLPPEESGISDYSALLLPHLSGYYDIDVVSDLERTTDAWVAANCTLRSVSWFRQNHAQYDRVVYQMGNSSFHGHMFDLLDDIPGVVVLHDFALSGIVAHQDALGQGSRPWLGELYFSHGYQAVIDQRDAQTLSDVVWKYPVNLRVLQQALGVVVHSESARGLADAWYGPGSAADWRTVPMPRTTVGSPSRVDARLRLGIDPDCLVVSSFGNIGPTKLTNRLVAAWSRSTLSADPKCRLFLVGDSHDPSFDVELRQLIRDIDLEGRVSITGRIDAEGYAAHLAAADIGVQLRTRSRGETSASAFDCLAHGLATIVNANGALSELPAETVLRIPDEFSDDDLAHALESLAADDRQRAQMSAQARSYTQRHHTPRIAAEAMVEAIEQIWARPINRRTTSVAAINRVPFAPQHPTALAEVALSLVRSVPVHPRPRQLFVDVSELNVRDAGSGIQRVTRNVVSALLRNPPDGFRVEPVAATIHSEFRAARQFTTGLLGLPAGLADDAIEIGPGDVFLGLDLQPQVVPSHRDFFRRLRRGGVQLAFVVYDLLPMLTPEYFYPGAAEMYERWFTTVCEADRLISISKTVQHDVQVWIDSHPSPMHRPSLSWFHLGVELDTGTEAGMEHAQPDSADVRPTFLMVGTIEPRKRHEQVLDAFEALWARGVDIDLVIAGRVGWMVDEFVERLRRHSQLDSHLHWLESATDDRLAGLYRSSAALIAASDAEGFGLPIVEAAKFDLPIIARDIGAFREVAGAYATYFSGHRPEVLASVIEGWLRDRASGEVPSSRQIHPLSWEESAAQLVDALLGAE